jgi:hypothetical protein
MGRPAMKRTLLLEPREDVACEQKGRALAGISYESSLTKPVANS